MFLKYVDLFALISDSDLKKTLTVPRLLKCTSTNKISSAAFIQTEFEKNQSSALHLCLQFFTPHPHASYLF